MAGPIERATNLLPQLRKNDSRLNYENFTIGFSKAIWGLFKKVVVADTLAIYVDSAYNLYEYSNGQTLLLATYLFAFQIYCDFSGYSDMAIGIARMLGYNIMENFNLPYFSKNVTEFWRRWHISLSSWLRDYLYIPLGGNRNGQFNTYKNLMITMLLGGLWHGASWNFIIWGFLNGLYLGIERITKRKNKLISTEKSIFKKVVFTFITFNLICFTWIFFRAQTFEQSQFIVQTIFSPSILDPLTIRDTGVFGNVIFSLGILLFFEYTNFRKKTFSSLVKQKKIFTILLFNVVVILMIVLFSASSGSQFIYFQF